MAGATVSYVISRWAWERKGRPHLLKETLPFVAVSISAGIILTLASKLGNQVAASVGLTAIHFHRTVRSKAPDRIQWI